MSADLDAVVATLQIDPVSRAAFEVFLDAQLADGLVEGSIKRRVVERLVELDGPVSIGDSPEVDVAPGSELTSGREMLAIAYVDHFAAHYQSIPDDIWDRLHQTFDDAELAELSWTIAVVKGMLRVSAALGLSGERR
jgi:hypothetical protein